MTAKGKRLDRFLIEEVRDRLRLIAPPCQAAKPQPRVFPDHDEIDIATGVGRQNSKLNARFGRRLHPSKTSDEGVLRLHLNRVLGKYWRLFVVANGLGQADLPIAHVRIQLVTLGA